MEKTAIMIDSSSGLKKEEIKKYKNTFLIPMTLILENGKEINDDEKSIKFDEFYKILKEENIKTSQISIGKIEKKWDKLLLKYENIIFIGLSKGLSGQHENISILANKKKYKNKIHVIDTDGVSQLNKKYFYLIYNWIKNEKIEFNEIQKKINELKEKLSVFIIPKNLETLKRGGRITPAVAKISSILKITPILRYNGKIEKFNKKRTFKKAIKTALEQIKKERENWKNIILVHSKIENNILKNVKKIINLFGSNIIETHILSNIIAAHTGADTIVLICWDK